MADISIRLVAIANGSYSEFPALDRAIPDARALADLLQSKDQFDTVVFPDLERGALLDAIEQSLSPNAMPNGTLILSWTGHGRIGADNTLRLIGHSGARDVEMATAGQLGEWAARTGARQVLVLIDTCFAGAALVDAARLADAVNNGRSSPGSAWFGVLAASLADEPALSGALSRELRRLLTEGPKNPDFRWDRKRPFIRGDDLAQALLTDWSETRQTPHSISFGRAWDLVRNPLYEPGLPDRVVEHLLQAARGSSGEENFFTGRESVLTRIVAWMGRREPGLFVVTGPPGSGKSAVVGRVVSLSSSAERRRVIELAPIPATLDPGEGSIDAHLHARGVTLDTAAEELLRQLALDPSAGQFGLLAEARRRRKAGDPLVVVIDGLDEARAFSRDLAAQLLAPLAQESLLIVATRDVPISSQESLIDLLGTAAERVDLGDETEGTRRDVREYVIRRLEGVDAAMDPVRVADEIATTGGATAPFLLARLVTSQLREKPVDTSAEGWQMTLSMTVESALERDLQSVVLDIDGKPHPAAAREMLRALAMAHGSGFPADDVWPDVASAISESATHYTRDDAYKTLTALGRHLVAGSEGDQPVYRIAHQRLVEYLSVDIAGGAGLAARTSRRVAVATAVFDLYDGLIESGLRPQEHTYLWRYAWRHLAEAGTHGLDLLRRLVDRNREAFLPDLAAGLELAASEAFSAGADDESATLLEQAVAVRRELGDPLRLSMSLFQLAMTYLDKGEQAAAADSAAEASKVTQDLPDTPERRKVVGAALLARAMTQLYAGRYEGAKLLADQAIALASTQESDADSDSWQSRATANVVAGRAAAALGDIVTAGDICKQTIDLLDQNGAQNSEVIIDALSTLAWVQYLRALTTAPDSGGHFAPASSFVAARLLAEYNREGHRGRMREVQVVRGLLFVVQSRLVDALRGVDVSGLMVPEVEALPHLLDQMIVRVTPFGAQSADATLILANVLQVRAACRVEKDPRGAEDDLSEAIRVLRRFSDESPLVAGSLGIILDGLTARDVSGSAGSPPNLDDLVIRQQEAVSCLRKGGPLFHEALAQALTRLAWVMQLAGRTELQEAANTEAIDVARALLGRSPNAPRWLAGLLCDQAALSLERPADAAQYASEALDLARSLPLSQQSNALVALCELNLGGSRMVLGEPSGVAELLRDAIDRMESQPDDPIRSATLATAYTNLAHLAIEAGRPAEAVPLARHALAFFDDPNAVPALAAKNIPKARLALGVALRRTGETELGSSIVGKVISEALDGLVAGRESPVGLASMLNSSGSDIWETTLPSLSDRPDLLRALKIRRIRPRDEVRLTVATFIEALAEAQPSELAEMRAIARSQRSLSPELFDEAWRDATGESPAWLQLDLKLIQVVISWVRSGSLTLSRDYLEAHPVLLNPAADLILEELRLASPDKSVVDPFLEILSKAREMGAKAAYAPLLVEASVKDWVNSDDLGEYFKEHPELLSPDVTAFVSDRAEKGDEVCVVLAAILELAKRGEQEIAFKAADNPSASLELLRPAWRSQDVTRLAALAGIVRGCSQDSAVIRKSTVALAIARVLEKRDAAAEAFMAEAGKEATDEDREQLIGMIGDAIPHHPSSAGVLAKLIQMLESKEDGSAVGVVS